MFRYFLLRLRLHICAKIVRLRVRVLHVYKMVRLRARALRACAMIVRLRVVGCCVR